MANSVHHVVVHSHNAEEFVGFLTDVVGMEVLQQFRTSNAVLEATMGWPPSEGADIWMLGDGSTGLVEVVDVPATLRATVPARLAAISFLTDDLATVIEKSRARSTREVVEFDTETPGVEAILTWPQGITVEFMQLSTE